MQGRYGTDKLNNALWVLLLILWFVNIFVWNRVARYIIDGIMLLIIVLICFRMFSRNIVARSAENRKFLPIYNAVTGWFRLTFKKIRDRKEYRYIKCPVCKAQLRVRNKKGTASRPPLTLHSSRSLSAMRQGISPQNMTAESAVATK